MPDEMDIASKIDAEAKVRAKLNEEAEAVMANSKPTPTQREADLIKAGVLHPDDKEDPNNPTMPHVSEQQRRIAEAGSSGPYRTRDMAPPRGAAERTTQAAQHTAPAQTQPAQATRHTTGAAASDKKDEDKK